MEGDTPAPSASADDASPDTSKNLANLSIGSVVNISPESITTRNKSGGGEATISKLHHDPTTGAVCKVDVKFVISGRTQKNVDVAHLSLHQEDLPKRRSRRSSAAAVNTSKEDHSKMDTETRGKDTAGEKKKTAASAKKKRNEDNEVEKKQPPKKEIDSNETDEDEDWILITGSEGNYSYYERLLQPPTRVLFWWDDDLGWIKGRVTKGLRKKLTKTSIKWLVSIFFEQDCKKKTFDFFPKALKRWKVFKEDVERVMNEVHKSEDRKLKGVRKVCAKTPSKSTESSKTAEKQSTKDSSGKKKTKQAVKASNSSSKKASKTSASSSPPIQKDASSATSDVGKAKATKPETNRSTSSKKEKLGESAQKSGPISVMKTSVGASTTKTAGSRSSLDANGLSETQLKSPISKSHGKVEIMTASADASIKTGINAVESASKTSSEKTSSAAFCTSQTISAIASDEKENESDTSSPKQGKVRETEGQKKRKPLGSLDPNIMSKSKKQKTEKLGIRHVKIAHIPAKPKDVTLSTSTTRSSALNAAQRRVLTEQQTDLRETNKGSDINKLSRDDSGSKSTLAKYSAPKVASLKCLTSTKPSPVQVSQSPSLQKSAPPVKSVGMRKPIPVVAEGFKATEPRKTSHPETTTTQTLLGKEREKANKLVDDVVGSQSKSRFDHKGSEDDSSSLHSSSGSSYSSTLELKFSNADQEVMNTFVNTILNTRDEIQVEELIQLLNSDRGIKKTSGRPFSTKEIEAHLERLDNESKIFLSKSEGSKGTIYKS